MLKYNIFTDEYNPAVRQLEIWEHNGDEYKDYGSYGLWRRVVW
jgi:hypothetical protein